MEFRQQGTPDQPENNGHWSPKEQNVERTKNVGHLRAFKAAAITNILIHLIKGLNHMKI